MLDIENKIRWLIFSGLQGWADSFSGPQEKSRTVINQSKKVMTSSEY